MNKIAWILLMCLLGFMSFSQEGMDVSKMDEIFWEYSNSIIGDLGYWEFYINGLPTLAIADATNNRMRIITPVSELVNISPGLYTKCLEANFHSALDVKYAISDDLLWVVYIHPLAELQEKQLISAISQVYNAALTFGESFSSTELVFPKKNENQKRN